MLLYAAGELDERDGDAAEDYKRVGNWKKNTLLI